MARVRQLIDGVEQRGAAAMMRGEAGIGKTALLAQAREHAVGRGMRILSTTGAHAEVDVPFASLHQLLRPLRTEIDALDAAQRDVLLAAFGTEVAAPQLYAIARAVLDLLSEAARGGAILVVVEDAHWLDRCTTDVLAFVARRLDSELVILLAASPTGFESTLDGACIEALDLLPLDEAASGDLLDAHAPGLPPALRERLLSEAEGNPLALVELPIAAGRLGPGAFLPTWLPLTDRLERAFATRAHGLPDATRSVLLVAALNDRDDLMEDLSAASALAGHAITLEDLSPAVGARLIETDDSALRFRHSLMRSAIRQTATVPRRHAAHAALAATVTEHPRRVWHRAAATVGTDDSVATELEEMAGRAQAHGNFADAVASLERAASLSSTRQQRETRLLRAAELAFELGRRDIVARLLAEHEIAELGPQQRARVMFISESLEDSVPGVPSEALAVADAAANASRRGDTELALNLLAAAGTRAWWGDLDGQIVDRLAGVALRLNVDQRDPRLLATVAWTAKFERSSQVGKRHAEMGDVGRADPAQAHLCGMAAAAIGHTQQSAPFFDRAVEGLRSEGRLALLAQALTMRAWCNIRLGQWAQAARDAEEGELMADQTRQSSCAARAIAAESMVAALRGNYPLAETLANDADLKASPARARAALFDIQTARGVAALGSGRYADAFAALRCVIDPSDPAYHSTKRLWLTGDVADAAAHGDQRDTVLALMPEIERACIATQAPDIHLALGHARAVLADDEHSEALFRSALEYNPCPPFNRARLHLAFGAWLRRERRTAESRPYLREAREELEALGAMQWARRADQELRATGENTRRRAESSDRMTPQESQIAEMAADGLTNREIGERLYLSHRTVGSHLYRIFPKLGISARNELGAALRDAEQEHDAGSPDVGTGGLEHPGK